MTLSNFKSATKLFLIAGIMIFSSALFAQNNDYDAIKKTLTLQQKEMLQQELKLMKQNRAELKASLTPEQLAIIQDKSLTKEQIRKRLNSSFCDEQLQLVERNENRLRIMRQNFQNSLTDGQRQMLQERVQQRNRISGEQGEMNNGTRSGENGTRGGGKKGKN